MSVSNDELNDKYDIALRTSYQLQAAHLLLQYPSLSNYFSLKALDSQTFHSKNNLNSSLKNDNHSSILNVTIPIPYSLNSSNLSCNVSTDSTIKELKNDIPPSTQKNDSTNHCSDIEEQEIDNDAPPSLLLGDDLLCPTCGLHLSSGHFGTTVRLRSLHRSSTRRRRYSRNRAKQCTQKSFQKQNNIQGNQNVMKADGNLNNSSLQYCLKRVKDGEASNCIVYTCGQCHGKMKFKGIATVTKNKQKERIQSEKIDQLKMNEPKRNKMKEKSIKMSSSEKKQMMQRKKLGSMFISHSFASKSGAGFNFTVSKNKGSGSLNGLNASSATSVLSKNRNDVSDEFLPLPNVGSETEKSSHSQGQNTKNDFVSPLQSRKKKRKRGRNDKSGNDRKSGLMDFLASLND